jgi:methionyl-tRNA formyltransferase
MNKKIVLISGKTWSLRYLKDSFSESMLKKTTLITDKVSNELKLFLKIKKIDLIKTNKLTSSKLKKLDIKNSVVLSCATPWIYTKDIIDILGKNFFNVHQSPLPSMRGSVASYIILYDIRAFQTCLHKVAPGIDTGNVVYRKSFIIPSKLKLPGEINIFLQSQNREMVKEFLNSYSKKKLINEKQNSFFASYNKRLSSKINGWIDWSMNVDDLDRFIRTYGNPYGGANTFIANKKVQIEDIEKSKNEPARHPEEIGCILRKFQDYIVISVNGGSLYIKKILINKKNIINSLKPGDKFFTKLKYLDNKNQRVLFVKKTKIYNKKIKLKKLS